MSGEMASRAAPLRETSSVIRTALLTIASGGVTFLITNGLHQDNSISITLSILIGGIALLVRFLVDFEKRLLAVERLQKEGTADLRALVERSFGRISDATSIYQQMESSALDTGMVAQLARGSAGISEDSPPIVREFAKAKFQEMAGMLKLLTEGGTATYYGEDRDWLLGLTKAATRSIDAISMDAVDHDLWESEIGRRYLDAQRLVAARGKRVRRIFMLEKPEMADDPTLRRVYEEQRDMQIKVRLLLWQDVPSRLRVKVGDLIIFDDILAYETTPTAGDPHQAQVAATHLVLAESRLNECTLLFGELWELARELPVSQRKT